MATPTSTPPAAWSPTPTPTAPTPGTSPSTCATRIGPAYFLDQANALAVTVNNVAPTTSNLAGDTTVSEGTTTHTYTYDLSDPGADTITAHPSCGIGGVLGANSNTSTGGSFVCTFADGPASPSVSVFATDDDAPGNGNPGNTVTLGVTVNNVEPTTTVSGAASVNEGSPYSLTLGAIVDPGTDTVSNIRINWGDGSFTNGAVVGANSHTYADGPNTWNITVDITDEDGTFLDQANAFSVTVNNVEPTLTISGAASVNEGSSYSLTLGAIADPGTDTVTDIRVNWGDGNSDVYPASGVVTHTYADGPNTWNITVDLRDEDSAPAYFLDQANALAVTVNNVAPEGTFGATTPVDEGSSSLVSIVDPTDPSAVDTAAGFHYAFACDGEDLSGATYAGSGTGSSTLCNYQDGPDSHTVKARIIDKDGGFTEYVAVVSVDNVSPIATFSNSGPIDEGTSATVTFSSPSDPGAVDTAAGFHYSFACDGEDSSLAASYALAGTSDSASCFFGDGPANQIVKGRIFDKDDGYTQYSTTVIVNNVNPTGTAANATETVDEGQTADNTGTYFDPGDDPITLSASAGSVVDNLDGTWSWSFATTDGPDDTQIVTIYGDDGDGAGPVAIASFDLIVNNVNPTGTAANATETVDEGQTADNTGTYFDPGDDPITLSASAGSVVDNLDGTWSWSFATTDGPDDTQIVTIYGDDGDGAGPVAIASFDLIVNNVNPTGTAANATETVDEGQTADNTGTYFDPGDDPITLSASAGSVVDNLDGTWSWSFATTDGPDDTQIVTIYGDDGDGAGPVAIASFDLIVNNVNPTGTAANATETVDEGQTADNTGTYFDPGDDPITLSASAGSVVDNLDGTWSWSFATTDGPDDTQIVTIYGDDGDGAGPVAIASFDLIVNNVAPTTSNLAGDTAVLESGVTTHTYTYDLADPGNDTISGHPSCGVGGTLVSSTNTNIGGSFVCKFLDGPASPTVSIYATDSDAPGNNNPGNTSSIAVSVANVDPTATFSNNGPVGEGSPVTVSFGAQSDPSPTDTTAGFHYAFSCTNATLAGTTYGASSASPNVMCTYGDNGAYTVRGRIIDKDGGFSEYTTVVTVTNVDPIRTGQSFAFNPFTGLATATVNFSDAGWLDVVSSMFNWAGTPVAGNPSSYGPGSGPGPLTGTFTSTRDFEPGCFNAPVSVRVSDDDGGYFDYTYVTSLNVYTVAWDPPIQDGMRNVVKKGNVIPLKLRVTDCTGAALTDKTLSIKVVAGIVDPSDIDSGVYQVPGSVSGADTTGFMRQVDSKYMYNLDTKSFSIDMPYTIVIKDHSTGQLVATAVIQAKK